MEALAARHLKQYGVTHISTTRGPEDPRITVLSRAKLPLRTPVPIDEWIEKLEAYAEARLAEAQKRMEKEKS